MFQRLVTTRNSPFTFLNYRATGRNEKNRKQSKVLRVRYVMSMGHEVFLVRDQAGDAHVGDEPSLDCFSDP